MSVSTASSDQARPLTSTAKPGFWSSKPRFEDPQPLSVSPLRLPERAAEGELAWQQWCNEKDRLDQDEKDRLDEERRRRTRLDMYLDVDKFVNLVMAEKDVKSRPELMRCLLPEGTTGDAMPVTALRPVTHRLQIRALRRDLARLLALVEPSARADLVAKLGAVPAMPAQDFESWLRQALGGVVERWDGEFAARASTSADFRTTSAEASYQEWRRARPYRRDAEDSDEEIDEKRRLLDQEIAEIKQSRLQFKKEFFPNIPTVQRRKKKKKKRRGKSGKGIVRTPQLIKKVGSSPYTLEENTPENIHPSYTHWQEDRYIQQVMNQTGPPPNRAGSRSRRGNRSGRQRSQEEGLTGFEEEGHEQERAGSRRGNRSGRQRSQEEGLTGFEEEAREQERAGSRRGNRSGRQRSQGEGLTGFEEGGHEHDGLGLAGDFTSIPTQNVSVSFDLDESDLARGEPDLARGNTPLKAGEATQPPSDSWGWASQDDGEDGDGDGDDGGFTTDGVS